jgi:hypothetical protein
MKTYSLPALLEMLREPCGVADCGHCEIERQAADEIERLQTAAAHDCETMACGHAKKWLAYREPVNPRSERYCVFCEIERLRAEVAYQTAAAAYHEHDAECCGGCTECYRLCENMQAAEKARQA